ncbi:hypothetical protein ACFPZK_12685 [Psychrobacter urativorans]|uniref:SMODS domain-containing nucleotidyltransferase n=1 Tax=Psychrobacter urativorans TaxID=45610 RepID=UPI00191B7AF0|nr:nucleotidyltransferase [Psychrobacter urativorans]
MTTASLFNQFIKNIHINNSDEISENYKKVTKALNDYYYALDNDSNNCYQIGSYGRRTGIHGISDLDMAFELPRSTYDKFNNYSGSEQSSLLQDVKKALQEVYEDDKVKADGQIVGVNLDGFRIEVLPTFYLDKYDDSNLDKDIYTYPDSNDGGSWKKTKPKKEIRTTRDLNEECINNTYRHLCRMIRAWKNNVGINFSGLWIDTLVYNFFVSHSEHKNSSYKSYASLVKDFFKYLYDQYEISPDKKIWRAPGSNQVVHGSWQGHRKIKKAYQLCLESLEDEEIANENWSKVFGVSFPIEDDKTISESLLVLRKAPDEQFVEYVYNGHIDIKNYVSIDYSISQESKTWKTLKNLLPSRTVPMSRTLEFYIHSIDVEPPYEVKWKVRNVGSLAKEKKQQRGKLQPSSSGKHKTSKLVESSNFNGEHWVECYIIKNNICVARDRISVPI